MSDMPPFDGYKAETDRQRKRASYFQALVVRILKNLPCPKCAKTPLEFYTKPSIQDPCELIVCGCTGCGATFSEYPLAADVEFVFFGIHPAI